MDELDWKIAELGHDFGPDMPYLLGFCLKFPKFWVSREKSAELASKFAWVRPKNCNNDIIIAYVHLKEAIKF